MILNKYDEPNTEPVVDEPGGPRGFLAEHQPEMGWPLLTLLVLIVVLNLVYLCRFIFSYGVRALPPGEQVSTLLFFQCAPILRIAGATALLRGRRWGYYAYMLATFGYLILSAYFDFHLFRCAQELFLFVILTLLMHPRWELFE